MRYKFLCEKGYFRQTKKYHSDTTHYLQLSFSCVLIFFLSKQHIFPQFPSFSISPVLLSKTLVDPQNPSFRPILNPKLSLFPVSVSNYSAMFVSRVLARVSRNIPRSSSLLSSTQSHRFPTLSNQFHSLLNESPNKLVPSQVSLYNLSCSHFQRFGIASTASPETSEKENGTNVVNNGESAKTNGDAKVSDQTESEVADQTKESDSEEDNLSMDDLVKLVAEKEELLKLKHKEIEKMQDKVLRSYAEMENVMDRTRREAENSKKFAIQSFAKSLLDVADNLGRASSVVKESFAKIDTSKDSAGAAPLLKTLLEGVEMTEKQLSEVFKKYGVEKYDPTNEPFDPHRHNAVFQLADASKPPGSVAVVLKLGYMLYDRVIRPAEVGVTQEAENDESTGQDKE